MNNLSDRLNCIANSVIPGEPVADVGTDHGFVPIHLLAENIVPFTILTDVNQGPIDIAASHLKEIG
ncbi:MAG: tRNA (adenine(22)-N(1))-methyltransferase TrmK, partial [Bacillota bacterium]|nr:tRNA (adenine(22)-N(1))-methyltransferase TrmK [Bacillota bacterium]